MFVDAGFVPGDLQDEAFRRKLLSESQSVVSEIKEKADIVEAIGRVVPLKRSGLSWVGLCPFHNETDGSFRVYEDGGNFYCYGCHAQGDIITFYEKYYHLDFKDAIERLCAEYGIDFKPFSARRENRDPLYKVNAVAARYYYDAMKVGGNAGRNYLGSRKIDQTAIKAFGIGYAGRPGGLHKAIKDDEELVNAALSVGLIYKAGNGYRDKFEDRVMFPILNPLGKVIGFGGRDVSGSHPAKYINSDASAVFEKGKNLYGLYSTGNSIRRTGQAILVEGYMDAVAVYMHGVENVAAQLGTAFTVDQAKLLKKYADTVVLATDMDESGRLSAEKSMEILRDVGIKVRVLSYEGGKDPDEYISKFGRAAFDEAVSKAEPMVEYKIDRIFAGYDVTVSDELAAAVNKSASYIARFGPGERGIYIRKLADRTGLSEESLRMQIESAPSSGSANREPLPRPQPSAGNRERLRERLRDGILKFLIANPERLGEASVFRSAYTDDAKREVLESLLDLSDSDGRPIDERLVESLSPDAAKYYNETLASGGKDEYTDIDGILFRDYVLNVEYKIIEDEAIELREKLAAVGSNEETKTLQTEILLEISRIDARKNEIKDIIHN